MEILFKIIVITITHAIAHCKIKGGFSEYTSTQSKLKQALTVGESLRGTTVEHLQTGRFRVEVSGGLENYSKWNLLLAWKCEEASGVITVPMRNVMAGIIEGFASRKTDGTATGSWVRCSLLLDEDMIAHFMYSAPFSFDFHSNWLAIALCSSRKMLCWLMNAEKMYEDDYPFLDRHKFDEHLDPVKICYDDVCMMGTMQRDHTPIVYIRVYPRSYYDLALPIREKLGDSVSREEYEGFIKATFGAK